MKEYKPVHWLVCIVKQYKHVRRKVGTGAAREVASNDGDDDAYLGKGVLLTTSKHVHTSS